MSEIERQVEHLIAQKEQLQQEIKEKLQPKSNLKLVTDDTIVNKSNSIRSEIIANLRMAKTSHIKWISNVQILMRLDDIHQANANIPVNYTMCDFGKWYYGEGQKLGEYSEYLDIEEVHQSVHDTYLQIYSLYKDKIEGSLFNSAKKQMAEREEKAQKLDLILKQYSKLLFELLLTLEKKVRALSNEEVINLM